MSKLPRNTCKHLAGLARAWFAVGILVLAFEPAARGVHPLLGWLPYWLLFAPLLVLAQCEAGRLVAAASVLPQRVGAVLRRRRPQARYRRGTRRSVSARRLDPTMADRGSAPLSA
jgi:hypothetical protein